MEKHVSVALIPDAREVAQTAAKLTKIFKEDRRMRKRSIYSSVLLLAVLASFTLAIGGASADENCKAHRLDFPDPGTLKLSDGEHVIAAGDTRDGKFEVRVTVKDKVASKPRLYIGGRLMRPISESQIPKDLRDCLRNAPPGTASNSVNSFENANAVSTGANPLAAMAPPKVFCFATATCGKALNGKYYCFGVVCCNSRCEDFYSLD